MLSLILFFLLSKVDQVLRNVKAALDLYPKDRKSSYLNYYPNTEIPAMPEHLEVIEEVADEDMLEENELPEELYYAPISRRESFSGDEQWVPGVREPYQPDPLLYDTESERSSHTPPRAQSNEFDSFETPRPRRILAPGQEPSQPTPFSPTRKKRTRGTSPEGDSGDESEASSMEVSPTDSSGDQLSTLPTVQSLVAAAAGPSSDGPTPHQDQLIDFGVPHNKRRRRHLKVPQEAKIVISNEKLRKQVRTLQHLVHTTEAGEVLKVRQEKAVLQSGLQKATTLISSQADRTADVSSERDDFEVKYNTAESELEDARLELAAAQNDINTLSADVELKDKVISDLNVSLKSKTEEISKLNEMVQARDKDLFDKDVELRKLKSDMISVEAKKTSDFDIRNLKEELQEANRQIQLLIKTKETQIAYKNEVDELRKTLEVDRELFAEDLLMHTKELELVEVAKNRALSETEEAKKAIADSEARISKAKIMEENATEATTRANESLKAASQDLQEARKLCSAAEEAKIATETLKAQILSEKSSVEALKRSAEELQKKASEEMKKANQLRVHYTSCMASLDNLIAKERNNHDNCSGFQRATQEASAQIAELKAKLNDAEIKLKSMTASVNANNGPMVVDSINTSKGKEKAPTDAPMVVDSINTSKGKEKAPTDAPMVVDSINTSKGKEKAPTDAPMVVVRQIFPSRLLPQSDTLRKDRETDIPSRADVQTQIRQNFLSKYKSIKPLVRLGHSSASSGPSVTRPVNEDEDDPKEGGNRQGLQNISKNKASQSTIPANFPVRSGKGLHIYDIEDEEMSDTQRAKGDDDDANGDDENNQEGEEDEEDEEDEDDEEDEEERAVTSILTRTGSASAPKGRYSSNVSFMREAKKGTRGGKGALEKDDKEVRKQYLALVRSVVKRKFGIERDADFVNHIPPSPGDIIRFETTKSPEDGPQIADLRIDMKGEISSKWNEELVSILVTFATNRKVSQFPDLPHRPQDYLAQMFLQKLERARTFWRNHQPKATELGTIETDAERKARVEAKRKKDEKRNRRNSRRASKYTDRLFTVQRMIEESEKRGDTAMFNLWSRLLSLLEALEEDGMSSEDSEANDGDTVYHVRQMSYRRNVDRHMELIDTETKRYRRNVSTQGSNKSRRIRGEDLPSLRKPFIGKPRSLYGPAWIKQQTQTTINRLKIPEKHPFKFFEIKVPDPSA
ncbi:hypothetical protein JR316_0009333 [Psilocybe cubensis]|uniref:Uncharacterized protein n=2 Tax=Psilocybe cubensis TaxID=181762 RepID=A0ACB8GUG8_PSICU|nr:hypothetical protein JR316_0009333 [Psilocybe cubensis]KAH9478871.1 hypothetical protein JR316_0009333 [Psilocybe cubensis]